MQLLRRARVFELDAHYHEEPRKPGFAPISRSVST